MIAILPAGAFLIGEYLQQQQRNRMDIEKILELIAEYSAARESEQYAEASEIFAQITDCLEALEAPRAAPVSSNPAAVSSDPAALSSDLERAALPDLHGEIMNLPLGPGYERFLDDHATRTAYKEGHKDARHYAAELCIAHNKR